ncbi:MAG: AbrB/MazE/SpoVT family DNA-binding domain-containing protein [Deltaproteobacteria bacterium]|nr:AbrB/MazE/SpoVT family DNA-binding domain-containing protein [Deltaproteobacteria bacterium]
MQTKVSERGQVSIPAKIRKRFQIKPKTRLEWIVEQDRIILLPVPQDPISTFRGRGGKQYTTADLLADRKVERMQENARDKG